MKVLKIAIEDLQNPLRPLTEKADLSTIISGVQYVFIQEQQ
jgi:hypothetical protein